MFLCLSVCLSVCSTLCFSVCLLYAMFLCLSVCSTLCFSVCLLYTMFLCLFFLCPLFQALSVFMYPLHVGLPCNLCLKYFCICLLACLSVSLYIVHYISYTVL